MTSGCFWRLLDPHNLPSEKVPAHGETASKRSARLGNHARMTVIVVMVAILPKPLTRSSGGRRAAVVALIATSSPTDVY